MDEGNDKYIEDGKRQFHKDMKKVWKKTQMIEKNKNKRATSIVKAENFMFTVCC